MRRVAILLALALASGCSSSKAAPTTTTTPKATTTTAIVATTTTTTAPSASSTTTSTTTTPSPTATTALPLETQLQNLLDRHDAAVAAILADPKVASDPFNPKVVTYLSVFTPDSSFAQGPLKQWAANGAKGLTYRPGPGGAIVKSTFLKTLTAVADEVTFFVCTASSAEVLDASGAVIEASGRLVGGEIVALNVNGAWLLRDLTQRPADECPKRGAGG
jgi:hypothetical protein